MQSHMILFGLALQERRRRVAARRARAELQERRAAAGMSEPETPRSKVAALYAAPVQAISALALMLMAR